jgi:mono/diheme cytochrome c family protein
MKSTCRWAAAVAAAALLASCRRAPAPPSPRRPPTRSVRVTMDALHRTGGVPPGWRLTPPPGDVASGRRLFVDFGCSSCHAVKGEPFSAKAGQQGVGPELTGMGTHHPADYFVESILNPDAVVVDAPGYVGPDGRSVMPAYPDMTLGQLADVVAYLQSLTVGGMQHVMTSIVPLPAEVPAPPPSAASRFLVQAYDVNPGDLQAFETWFRDEGTARFFAYDGLLSIDTWVDVAHDRPALVTAFGFRDDAALARFVDDPALDQLARDFDAFAGPHAHQVMRSPPVYRAASLSAERPASPP